MARVILRGSVPRAPRSAGLRFKLRRTRYKRRRLDPVLLDPCVTQPRDRRCRQPGSCCAERLSATAAESRRLSAPPRWSKRLRETLTAIAARRVLPHPVNDQWRFGSFCDRVEAVAPRAGGRGELSPGVDSSDRPPAGVFDSGQWAGHGASAAALLPGWAKAGVPASSSALP